MTISETKSELRQRLGKLRRQLENRAELSTQISDRLQTITEWSHSKSVLFYVDVRSEVQTSTLLQRCLTTNKKCIVPYCCGDVLKLIHIQDWQELAPGSFGILEPAPLLRDDPTRQVSPERVELALVPGVAFDRLGGRLGYGRGFYDRLLPQLSQQSLRIGLAFACQLVPLVPMAPHDQRMNLIVTDREIIQIETNRSS